MYASAASDKAKTAWLWNPYGGDGRGNNDSDNNSERGQVAAAGKRRR